MLVFDVGLESYVKILFYLKCVYVNNYKWFCVEMLSFVK